MSIFEFDQQMYIKVQTDEAREDGRAEGRAEARKDTIRLKFSVSAKIYYLT